MPRCQEFSSSELCTTTERILYNLDESPGGGLERWEKEVDWDRGERSKVKSQKCLLWFFLNVRENNVFCFLVCLQIGAVCWVPAEESWKECVKADTETWTLLWSWERRTTQKTNGAPSWPWRWIFKTMLFCLRVGHHRAAETVILAFTRVSSCVTSHLRSRPVPLCCPKLTTLQWQIWTRTRFYILQLTAKCSSLTSRGILKNSMEGCLYLQQIQNYRPWWSLDLQ